MGKSFSGARCRIYADGKQIGWATGVEVNEQTQMVRVDVLDNPYTEEIEPVGITVDGRIAMVKMYGNTLAEQGIQAQGDKLTVILKAPMTLTITDSIYNKPLINIYGCKFTSRSFNVDRMSVTMSNVSFQAIRMETLAAVNAP